MGKPKNSVMKYLIYGAVSIISIIIIGWLISIHTNVEPAKESVKTIYVGQDNEVLDNFTRTDAVNSLVELLKEASKDIEGKERSIDERLEALEAGEDIHEVLNEKALSYIYFEEEFGSDEYNRRLTATAILIQAKLVQEFNEEFEPMITMYDEAIMFDEKRMNAQVPLDIIIGVSTGYAFDMVYVDGNWSWNPYSIIMSLKLSDLIVNSQN